jgi:hypothetical protein
MNLSIDREIDVALIDLVPGQPIDRSVRVERSLLANYDTAGVLISVELLSLGAILRSDVADDLRRLLGNAAALVTSALAGMRGLSQQRDLVDVLAEGGQGVSDAWVGPKALSTV